MIDSKKIFVDSAPFIYFFNNDGKRGAKALDLFLKFLNKRNILYTSKITEVECKIRPMRDGLIKQLINIDNFFNEFDIKKLPINDKICDLSLEIRARYKNISLIDALQLASAEAYGMDMFLTNDKELTKYKGIKIIYFDNL